MPAVANVMPMIATLRAPERVDQRLRQAGADLIPKVTGKKASPARQRVVAEDILDVQGGEEEHREHCRGDEQQRRVGDRQRPDAEDAQTHQRCLGAGLDHQERRQQGDRERLRD